MFAKQIGKFFVLQPFEHFIEKAVNKKFFG